MNISLKEFIQALSSKSPVPGGGGASALIGAVSAALCSMVANLTAGKKEYSEYQDDIDRIIKDINISINKLLLLIEKDAEVFEPLAKAYKISQEQPDRDLILEKALVNACSVPLDIIREVSSIISIIEELKIKGTRLAVSDVGVAASACKSALESAAMNVYINTYFMKDKEYALKVNSETAIIIEQSCKRCSKVYYEIVEKLW
jgi:formiminotetrahydrofolate cyclodeaminase